MKKYLTVGLSAVVAALSLSCTPDPVEAPRPAPSTPGFISKMPSALVCDGGSVFTLSVEPLSLADSYEWAVADALASKVEIVSGQGTPEITVETAAESFMIPAGTFSVAAVNKTGKSGSRKFGVAITVKAAGKYQYRTKVYGKKEWFVENCREAGPNNDLGTAVNISAAGLTTLGANGPAILDANGGRYYTWYEAVTGIPACLPSECPITPGSTGVDDAGNRYTMDGTAEGEFNVQIRGCCPEGWHIPNCNDWWDLLGTIEDEYAVSHQGSSNGFSLKEAQKINGTTYGPIDQKTFYLQSGTAANLGNVGAYLKASCRVKDGGVWIPEQGFFSWGGADFKTFLPEAEKVGFNWYPLGYVNVAGALAGNAVGNWGYQWTTGQIAVEGNPDAYVRVLCLSGTSQNNLQMLNTARGECAKASRHTVRCVKNY